MSVYCDLCAVLSLQYGLTTRPLIVHDITTLGWLLDPMSDTEVVFPRLNCVKGGTRSVKASERQPTNRARLAAALSCYVVAVKIRDDMQDEPSWRTRAVQSYYSTTFAAANRDLQQLAFPLDQLEATLAQQAGIEKHGVEDLDIASQPTGRAYAIVARKLAGTSQTSDGAPNPAVVENAALIGEALGRCVYIIDAYRDADADRGASYNPLCCGSNPTDLHLVTRRREARAYVALQLRRVNDALMDAPVSQHTRWRAIDRHLRKLVGLQSTTVTLNATCCLPCGDGAVTLDDKDCCMTIVGCVCCTACCCQIW
jgi:hypothetical protein